MTPSVQPSLAEQLQEPAGAEGQPGEGQAPATPKETPRTAAAVPRRKRSLIDETPLGVMNERLKTASKTVSCRKKPRTPCDFGFAIPTSFDFSAAHCNVPVSPEETRSGQPAAAQAVCDGGAHPGSAARVLPMANEPCEATQEIEGEQGGTGGHHATTAGEDGASHGTADDAPVSTASPRLPDHSPGEGVLAAATPAAQGLPKEEGAPSAARTEEDSVSDRPTDSGGAVPETGGKASVAASVSNIVSGVSSFVSLVKPKPQAAPVPASGKSQVKIKALEAANAARKEAEAKEAERVKRIEAAKLRREQARAAASKVAAGSQAGKAQFQGAPAPSRPAAPSAMLDPKRFARVPLPSVLLF